MDEAVEGGDLGHGLEGPVGARPTGTQLDRVVARLELRLHRPVHVAAQVPCGVMGEGRASQYHPLLAREGGGANSLTLRPPPDTKPCTGNCQPRTVSTQVKF